MRLDEYANYDGLGLAGLVAAGDVTPRELAHLAAEAIAAVDPDLKAVVEVYSDRIADLDEQRLGSGPFRGVPFLIKDVGGHEKGRKIEYGSRLCEGMVAEFDTNFGKLLRAAGLNIIGRSNTPEYSIAGSAENALYGNTSTPWRLGHSAGGSSGGAAAAVAAGLVPLAHGSDIAGSIRIPACWCGGVGLKPSRGLISAGPVLDEAGFGLAMSFVQSKTVRDTAAMLDCLAVPQPGDPFIVQRPVASYAQALTNRQTPLKIAWTAEPLANHPVDPEVAAATEAVALHLQEAGHNVEEAKLPFDHDEASRAMAHFWFFGFHQRLEGYAAKTGRTIGPDTLEPVVLEIYNLSRRMDPYQFLTSLDWLNQARRTLGAFFAEHDVLVSPSCAIPSPPHGPYGLSEPGWDPVDYIVHGDKPVQYSFPFNVTGGPAISLPLAMHSTGLPIGIQLAAGPSQDHILLGLAAGLEEALPWTMRRPPMHVAAIARA
ncbi:MAG: amidase [Pseudomonadota bacterium]